MRYELDHVFCFCEPTLPEAAVLEAAGFVLSPPRRHQGQGTANRTVIFAENYLELIHLEGEGEPAAARLELGARARWRETGASPFGICLRGAPGPRDRCWDYAPPYWRGGIIPVVDAPASSPLVFFIDGQKPSLWTGALLDHKTGTRAIREVALAGRGEWPLSEKPAWLEITPGEPELRLTLDGQSPPIAAGRLLRLTFG